MEKIFVGEINDNFVGGNVVITKSQCEKIIEKHHQDDIEKLQYSGDEAFQTMISEENFPSLK